MSEHAGYFITLEGGEGAGKSAAIEYLTDQITRELPDVALLKTYEPGSSRIGSNIRQILLHSEPPVSSATEALLFAAERAQHMSDLVRPHLESGGIVISDRFVDSSMAYQAVGRGLDPQKILELSMFATGGILPDLTIILDVDPIVGLERKHNQKELNSMEEEPISFHLEVRQAFLDIAEKSERYMVIDASIPQDQVAEACWRIVKDRLGI